MLPSPKPSFVEPSLTIGRPVPGESYIIDPENAISETVGDRRKAVSVTSTSDENEMSDAKRHCSQTVVPPSEIYHQLMNGTELTDDVLNLVTKVLAERYNTAGTRLADPHGSIPRRQQPIVTSTIPLGPCF